METLKKISIKVQRMPISSFLRLISSFSVMPEMSSLGAFFGERSSLLFWQKCNFVFVGKRNTTLTNMQKTSYFHVFFEKYHLSFSVRKKHIIFSSWYKKYHIPVQFFWKDYLFGTFEDYIIFPCIFFLRKIIFHFPPKEYYHIFGENKYHLCWWY